MDRLQHAIDFSLQKLGYKEFRKNQASVIEKYIGGKDVLFCSPTGSGKSLLFEIAPLLYQQLENKADGCTCVVVSPLSTLIKSQVLELTKKGIKAIYLKEEEREDILSDINNGKYELIFASPETLLQSARDTVYHMSRKKYLKTIFVDEAHCIKKFGRSEQNRPAYRPFYGCLGDIRSLAGPSVPVVALTATASETVKNLIIKDLCLGEDTFQLNVNPNKPNIKYMVFESKRTRSDIARDFDWLVDLLRRDGIHTPRMIIFFRKIEHISDVFEHLEISLGIHGFVNIKSSTPNDGKNRLFDMYHLKTDDEVKEAITTSYHDPNGHIRVVLCSTSFSMGLDVKGVSTIIHYGSCNDLDDYLQESGRAGRSQDDDCHAIVIKYKQCLSSKHITQNMKNFIKTENCRRQILLQPFTNEDVKSEIPHNCCDNCARVCSCMCSCDAPESCCCEIQCSKNDSFIYNRMKYFQETDAGMDDGEYSNEGYSTDDDFEEHRCRRPQIITYSSEED